MVQNKRFVFKQPADGYPKPGQDIAVEIGSFDLDGAPPPGGLITKNLYFSFDPYLRTKMRPPGPDTAHTPFEANQTIWNFGVGKVVKSDSDKVKEGDTVATLLGAEEYSAVPKALVDRIDFCNIPNDNKLPLSHYCGILGMPGLTAYSSLYEIGAPKKGETLWVSAASGAVGQIVGQLGKHLGMKVIGSVGSDDKLEYIVKKLNFDAGFNYKKEKPLDAIHRLAPEGIDVYYDNVGGEQLDVALETMKNFGRIIGCGQISQYNLRNEERYGIKNSFMMVGRRLKYQGFIVSDENMGPKYNDEFMRNLSKWLLDGSFVAQDDVTEGIDKAPEAFVGMLKGENFGKAVLKIADA